MYLDTALLVPLNSSLFQKVKKKKKKKNTIKHAIATCPHLPRRCMHTRHKTNLPSRLLGLGTPTSHDITITIACHGT